MRRLLRRSGLALVTFGLFVLFLAIQSLTGNREHNEDQREHNEAEVGYVEYLGTGHFKESVFENWESEFLQMGAYVLLTVFLRQKGSPESKELDVEEGVDAEPDLAVQAHRGLSVGVAWPSSSTRTRSPWPSSRCYWSPCSCTLGGAEEYGEEQEAHGERA